MDEELVNSREVKLEDHNYNVSGSLIVDISVLWGCMLIKWSARKCVS